MLIEHLVKPKQTIDITVTRGTLWFNNSFKSANIIIPALFDQSVPLVTVRSNVFLLTEQL